MVIYLYRIIIALILLLLSSCIDDPIGSTISDDFISSITMSEGALFISTSDGRILTSTDGSSWEALSISNSLILLDIQAKSGNIVAVGDNGVLFTSPNNGESWNKRASGVFSFLSDVVVFNDSTYFVGGNSGNFIKTTDYGETWETITTPFSTQISALALKNETIYIGLRKKSQDSLFIYKYDIAIDTVVKVEVELNSLISTISNIDDEIYIADYNGVNRLTESNGIGTLESIYSNSEEAFIIQKILKDTDGLVLIGYEGFNIGKVISGVPNNTKIKNFEESIYFNTGIIFNNKLIVGGGDENEIAIRENNNWEIIKLK